MTQRLGIASLDDARKRRKRHGATAANLPDGVPEQPSKADAEDYSSYALDLAGGLLSNELDAPAENADAILAQHEAAGRTPSSAVALDEEADAPADEILLALEAHHQRTAPQQRQAAPRGSADLDPHQPQQPRAKPARAHPTARSPRSGRRSLVACGIAAVLVAIAITVSSRVGGANPRPAERQAVQTVGDYPTRGLLRAPQQHVPGGTRAHKRAHRSTHHTKPPAPPHASPTTSASTPTPTPAATPHSSSVAGSTASAASSGSTATASGSQGGGSQGSGSQSNSASSSSARPAGPAGPGGTVGGNCNPKCS